jgi:hypothetical protein
MALESLGPDDLTGAGFFESFGGGTIGFYFGHYGYSPFTQITGASQKPPARSEIDS